MAGRICATAAAFVLLAYAGAPVAVAAPSNDAFAAANVLTGEAATATGTNLDATKEPGEPVHAGNPGGHSVWWQWKAPVDGAVTIETCGSNFDTLLAVYTGDVVTALTAVAANDDAACGGQSSVTFLATSGTTYRIAVDGRYDATGTISLSLGPTLEVRAARVVRRHAVDATRFVIDARTAGDADPEVPSLVLVRNGQAQDVDLEPGSSASKTHFAYTFTWSCARHGNWTWTVSARRGGATVSRKGKLKIPRCEKRSWFVSQSRVRRAFAGDFGKDAARRLRCSTAGTRKDAKASKWRCTVVRPGYVCRGSYFFSFSETLQSGEVVAQKRTPSGTVKCRR
jgi:hypothetical protein